MASEARDPRLAGGLALSVLLHGGLVIAFFVLRAPAAPPTPPVFRVQLFAAPAGARAIGVVQPSQAEDAVPQTPPPATKATPTVNTPSAKTRPVPKRATPVPAPPAKATKAKAAPAAGGGPEGGKGADVANVDTPGIEFPYPAYVNNIARQIILQFERGRSTRAALHAEVQFLIRRDGTVPPESIRLVTSSGVYSFNQDALAAVEAAANARSFGPLPPGFREDVLPVNFRFDPSVIR